MFQLNKKVAHETSQNILLHNLINFTFLLWRKSYQ